MQRRQSGRDRLQCYERPLLLVVVSKECTTALTALPSRNCDTKQALSDALWPESCLMAPARQSFISAHCNIRCCEMLSPRTALYSVYSAPPLNVGHRSARFADCLNMRGKEMKIHHLLQFHGQLTCVPQVSWRWTAASRHFCTSLANALLVSERARWRSAFSAATEALRPSRDTVQPCIHECAYQVLLTLV
jgi:hypothetical protein